VGGQRKRAGGGEYIKAPPHQHAVIIERTNPSLVTQGWVDDKPCSVTVNTEAYVTVAKHRHCLWMAQKTVKPMLQAADCIWESPPHLEGSSPDTDPGTAPTENLVIHCQYHK
jgi:hypothetical protein